MTKAQNSKQVSSYLGDGGKAHDRFEHVNFGFRNCFGFRASNFEFLPQGEFMTVCQSVLMVALMFLAMLLNGCASSSQRDLDDEVVARINDEVVTRKELERFFAIPEDIEPDVKKMIEQRYLNPDNRQSFLNRLITRKLLLQEAKRRGLDERADFQERVRKFIEGELLKELENEIERTVAVSERELREYYDTHREKYLTPVMVRLQQIRVENEHEAKKLLEELTEGEDFAQLAKVRSTDLFATAGGDIGYYPEHSLVPEVRRVVSKMRVGDVSGIIQRPGDYVIVKLADRRKSMLMAFEEVKEKIRAELLLEKKKKAHEDFVARLKAKSRIAINEEWLKNGGDELSAKGQ